MEKFVVSVWPTLRVDILIEAETAEEALDKVSEIYDKNDTSLFDIERDFVADMMDYEVQTLEDSIKLDGIDETNCITL